MQLVMTEVHVVPILVITSTFSTVFIYTLYSIPFYCNMLFIYPLLVHHNSLLFIHS